MPYGIHQGERMGKLTVYRTGGQHSSLVARIGRPGDVLTWDDVEATLPRVVLAS